MKLNIKNKIFFTSAVQFVVVISIIFCILIFSSYQIIAERLQANLFNSVSSRTSHLETYFNLNIERLNLVTSRTKLRATLQNYNETFLVENLSTMRGILKDAKSSVEEFKSINILDKRGRVLVSTSVEKEGINYSEEDFFIKGLYEEGVHFRKEKGEHEIYVSGPIKRNGAVIGVGVTIVDFSTIYSIVHERVGLGETGEILIAYLGEENELVFPVERLFEKDSVQAIEIGVTAAIPMQAALNNERMYFSSNIDYRNKEVVAATEYLSLVKLGIVSKIDKVEAYAPLRRLIFLFVLLGIVFILIYILLSKKISEIITNPIKDLKRGIEKISGGDESLRVGMVGDDEISQLSRSFDELTRKLKMSKGEIKKIVSSQTKEIGKKAVALDRQQKAIMNILEDEAEEKQKTKEEKLKVESLLVSIGDGILATDQDGQIMIANQAAEKMLSKEKEEIIGKPVIDILPLVDSKNKKIPLSENPIVLALSSGDKVISSTTHKYNLRRNKNDNLPIGVTVTPYVQGDQIIGSVVVFRDVSQLDKIDRMKTEFVSIASHQLRTPLTSMRWYLEMLRDGEAGKISKQQREFVEEIYVGSQRMSRLVNDLLNVSRLETGRLKIDSKPVNIVAEIKQNIKEIEPLAGQKGCKIKLTSGKLPSETVNLDKVLFWQVVHNMLTNAIKYSKKDACSVGVKLEFTKEKEYVVAITDSGIGIPKNQQSRIFQKFFRADSAVKSEAEGTGLGLYLAHMIMKSAGGRIWFESTEGKGTTFYIAVPEAGMNSKEGEKALAI